MKVGRPTMSVISLRLLRDVLANDKRLPLVEDSVLVAVLGRVRIGPEERPRRRLERQVHLESLVTGFVGCCRRR